MLHRPSSKIHKNQNIIFILHFMIGINVYSLFDNNMEHVSNNQYQDNGTARCSGQDPIKLSHSASDENLHYLDIWYRGSWAGTDW